MRKRWISLLLVFALVLAVWSVCAVAADAQKADEAADETTDAEPAAEEPVAEETPAETASAPDEEADAASEDTEAPAEDSEQNHIHAVNREDSCEEPSFVALPVTGGTLESGCYYLTDDLALEEPLCVPKNGAQVTLCLNGHTLRLADGVEGCILFVAVSDEDAEPSVLTVTDCNGADSSSNYYVDETGALVFDNGSYAWQEAYIAANEKNALAGGRITGATAGAISVGDYNQLYLSGVNIIDNEGRYGAGVVIGETAEVKSGVVIYQGVTLGGTGNETGKRHPTLGNNVLIGAGTKVLGPVYIGDNARIGAGSVVLKNLPANCTAVGVPAEVVRINNKAVNPADDLDQQDLPDVMAQRLLDLDRRIGQLEKAAQGDIPPTAQQVAARQRKSLRT
mgnify:CR=1 FL=1